jgi:hypothetical protein
MLRVFYRAALLAMICVGLGEVKDAHAAQHYGTKPNKTNTVQPSCQPARQQTQQPKTKTNWSSNVRKVVEQVEKSLNKSSHDDHYRQRNQNNVVLGVRG